MFIFLSVISKKVLFRCIKNILNITEPQSQTQYRGQYAYNIFLCSSNFTMITHCLICLLAVNCVGES